MWKMHENAREANSMAIVAAELYPLGASGRWEHLGKSSACPVKTQLAELTFAAKNRLRVNLPKAARSESIEGSLRSTEGNPMMFPG